MGKTIRIVTHNLNGRTVGQIVEMTGLNGAAARAARLDLGHDHRQGRPVRDADPPDHLRGGHGRGKRVD